MNYIEKVEIGNCTLYHGDCLDILPHLKADMIFMDPPYGHNNNNGDLIHRWDAALGKFNKGESEKARPILNDGHEANALVRKVFKLANTVLIKGGCCCCCCCCGGGGPDPQFARWSLWLDKPLEFKQMVVWDKGKIGMGWHYRRSYEVVLVAAKRGGKHKWHAITKNIENIIRPGDYGIRKIIPKKTDHPTPKPVNLSMHFINLHSEKGEVVLDPFMGHGSTGVAAIRAGRKFIGIELDKEHFDAACVRISKEIEGNQ